MGTPRHDCRWRTRATQLEEKLAKQSAELDLLTKRMNEVEHNLAKSKKQIVGPKSERIPTPEQEARASEGPGDKPGGFVNPERRRKAAKARTKLPTETLVHTIPEPERRCSHCGDDVKPIGKGDVSAELEWVPGRLVRRLHVVETGRCRCKLHYARGPAPARVYDGCQYGPGFLAKLVVDKCCDSTPIHRIERAMQRLGHPVARSTMNDLVLRAADVCEPLWRAAMDAVRTASHLQADETSFKLQTSPARSFVWTFLSEVHTIYIFSESRSGETPSEFLGGTTGHLLIDGYTGYNSVTTVEGRIRAGCWSHARRYLFEALPTAPEARDGLDRILDLFLTERAAQRRGIVGTDKHRKLRSKASGFSLNRIKAWRDKMLPRFEPASPMGAALRYLKNQWSRLIAFVDEPLLPIHNNASESALRIVALARKNSLFFGNAQAGKRFAILYSLTAMCARHDVNPEAYLTDVLIRIHDHPKSRLAELLPDQWKLRFATIAPVIVDPVDAT